VISFSVTSLPNIPNLKELQEAVRQSGGAIVCYHRMYSVVFLTHTYPVFVWVPPGRSRIVASLSHVGFSAALGWWSVIGWLGTPFVIAANLAGGEEVTRRVMRMSPATPAVPDSAEVHVMGIKVPGTGSKEQPTEQDEIDPLAIEEEQREQRRQSWVAGTLLTVIFVASMIFFLSFQFRRH
jgi:hypothetical protein